LLTLKPGLSDRSAEDPSAITEPTLSLRHANNPWSARIIMNYSRIARCVPR
jgi:hypothetical protein